MGDDALDLVVTDNTEHDRFEVRTTEGDFAGFAAYRRHDDRVVLTHTVVADMFEGHGVGSFLAAHALDAIRSAGARAVIVCPFITTYVERHPEYADLVEPVQPGDLEFDA
jgi:predicted GNAT family acetyltransferase